MADAPQHCPGCHVSLRDPTLPLKYAKKPRYRHLFTRAEIDPAAPVEKDSTGWRCPDCGHTWRGPGNHV